MTGDQQWLRACSLIVADQTGNGIELAGDGQNILRIRFTVNYKTVQSPANMVARIYNLSPNTIQNIKALASKDPPTDLHLPSPTSAHVVLKAGYQENIGTLFRGQVFQLRAGKESNVDSYLDIFAADGAFAYDWAALNKTFAAGYKEEDVWLAAGASMNPWQVATGPAPPLASNPSPRGKVLFGMTRSILRDHAASNNYTFNILDGQLQAAPMYQARAGEQAVAINSDTGMIGVPEQTEEGITVTTLLNSQLRWGSKVQINETDISRFLINNPDLNAPYAGTGLIHNNAVLVPPLNVDGIYVVVQVVHIGDTRGNEWFSNLVCVTNDPTTSPILGNVAQHIPLPPPFNVVPPKQ